MGSVADRGVDASSLPAVDRVLAMEQVAALVALHGRTMVLRATRDMLADLRSRALAGALDVAAVDPPALVAAIRMRVEGANRPSMRSVYNLTGTVLHTNFGRALLPAEAVSAVVSAMRDPVALEFDLVSGRRGERDSLVEPLLRELCGAEAATVVNNCAAALLLTLGALGRRREVIVSRGELIEIGGSFRLPDLMRAAGVKLVEVGTTNRTHLADYADAIGPRTAMLLKVHPSNYVVSGYTAEATTAELASLAHDRGLPLVVDLGSGALVELAGYGLPAEPVVAQTIAAGADLVLFSGDKLLGGPQAGLIAGRQALVRKINRDPLKRALRPGKLTLAALEAVLRIYQAPEQLGARLTTLAQLTRPASAIAEQVDRVRGAVAAALAPAYLVASEPVESQIGSGAQPGATLPSHALVIRSSAGRGAGLERLARRLRALEQPMIGRLAEDRLVLDLRCLCPSDEAHFCAQVSRLHE